MMYGVWSVEAVFNLSSDIIIYILIIINIVKWTLQNRLFRLQVKFSYK